MDSRIEIKAGNEHFKVRLDDFLFDKFNGLSKMYLREIVKNERCEVNGRAENIGYKLRPNDLIEIHIDTTRETAMRPENVPVDIVFEDEHLLVVNKPAGTLVHPTHRDKSGTLLNALAYHLNRGKIEADVSGIDTTAFIRAGLIHRLDKHTSGLMVVAKTARTHRILADHFKRKFVEKRYLALVNGVINDGEGTINAPIGRFAELKFWDIKADGKHAETRFWVRERRERSTLLELEPVTGRTNQLRIHCSSIGHPIVGDVDRGGPAHSRLCLHAWKLTFRHPNGGEPMTFERPIEFEDPD
ncbi:MAG: RluA family pseudouridine synthase [Pyrinomonadaceae bacterium]|nr:RluA family pseudouridine synthase [Pyrinomonadaceae bacterium]MBP6212506.1 RluA family pseudouridine synthase [Pyrinomonadaceae bacterium]